MFWQRSVPVKDGDFALQFFGYNLPFFSAESMLQVDPNDRPTIHDVVDRVQEIARTLNVNLKGPLQIAKNVSNIGIAMIQSFAPSTDTRQHIKNEC